MNPREKKILVLTIVLLVVFVAYRMMGGQEGFSLASLGGGGRVVEARVAFLEAFEILRKGPAIDGAFARVDTKLPKAIPGRTPELTFSDEVTRILVGRNWQTPKVKPPKTSEIKDVEDYYYIDLEISVTGPLEKLVDLMVFFQEQNILVKNFKLEKPRVDSDQVNLDVTVSRLARADPEERKKSLREE